MGDHRYDVLEDHREKRERRRQCELIHGAFHHGDLALDPFQTRLSARLDEGDDVCAGEDGRGLREWLCRTALRATGGLVSGCISRLMWRWSRLSRRRGDGVIDRLMWRWSRLIDSSFTSRNRGESLGRWQHCLLRNLVTRYSDNHSLSCTQCSDFGKQCRQ